MAKAPTGDKTEKATPHKLRQARRQGQIPRSRDLALAIGLLVAFKLIFALMPHWLDDFRQLFALAFTSLAGKNTLANVWSTLFFDSLLLLIKIVLPLSVIPCAIAAASLFPGGWLFTSIHFKPQLNRLNPLTHFSRITSPQHLSEMAKSITKALMLGLVLYYVSQRALADFFALQRIPLDTALTIASNLLLDALLALTAVFVLFAAIDLPLQVFLFQRQQRMSKQELKDEYKTTEGRPEVKRRLRQMQQQLIQRSVRKVVPTADVVIVNPTHYAVALKYDEGRAEAPFIVAKGIDAMALYIRQVAHEHALDVVSIPPLARAVYHTTQVNQQIPAPLYRAVAQVLTYILQLKAFRAGTRTSQPVLPSDLSVPRALAEPRSEP